MTNAKCVCARRRRRRRNLEYEFILTKIQRAHLKVIESHFDVWVWNFWAEFNQRHRTWLFVAHFVCECDDAVREFVLNIYFSFSVTLVYVLCKKKKICASASSVCLVVLLSFVLMNLFHWKKKTNFQWKNLLIETRTGAHKVSFLWYQSRSSACFFSLSPFIKSKISFFTRTQHHINIFYFMFQALKSNHFTMSPLLLNFVFDIFFSFVFVYIWYFLQFLKCVYWLNYYE